MIRPLLLLLACAAPQLRSCELLIAAASDLTPLEGELKKSFRSCNLRFSFASSGTLARQIRAGADFDVFLSADRQFVTGLVRDGKADAGTVTPYALGRIAVWSRNGLSWQELGKARTVAIANPALAPYGRAARQALERGGIWKTVESRMVYGENIRQAWQFAKTGNADAAIVSWSLVHAEGAELIPAHLHDPVEQTGVVPVGSRNPGNARNFLRWLVSPATQKLLANSGLEAVR